MAYDLGNVKVYCKDGISGTTPLSVTKLAAELDPARFIKVSRTHIVNLAEILLIKPTLRRNKTLVLKEPYGNVGITVTSEMIRELKQRMDLRLKPDNPLQNDLHASTEELEVVAQNAFQALERMFAGAVPGEERRVWVFVKQPASHRFEVSC